MAPGQRGSQQKQSVTVTIDKLEKLIQQASLFQSGCRDRDVQPSTIVSNKNNGHMELLEPVDELLEGNRGWDRRYRCAILIQLLASILVTFDI